jgi:hypothetical protein
MGHESVTKPSVIAPGLSTDLTSTPPQLSITETLVSCFLHAHISWQHLPPRYYFSLAFCLMASLTSQPETLADWVQHSHKCKPGSVGTQHPGVTLDQGERGTSAYMPISSAPQPLLSPTPTPWYWGLNSGHSPEPPLSTLLLFFALLVF